MGKKKKKKKKQVTSRAKGNVQAHTSAVTAAPQLPASDQEPPSSRIIAVNDNTAKSASLPADPPTPPESRPQPASAIQNRIANDSRIHKRLKHMLPDIIRVALALSVIALGAAIWWKPPLRSADSPIVTFKYRRNPFQEAELFRPLAMRERYYIKLPETLENRYEWFVIDRRREVVALCEAPAHSFLGQTAIKRSDDLGLDLEFRNIDGSEWLIHFHPEAIVFSNNILTVRLDVGIPEGK